MPVTPQDVQALLDTAVDHLKRSRSTYAQMVGKYGADPVKWPHTSQWYLALVAVAAARAAAGQIQVNTLTAAFTAKEEV